MSGWQNISVAECLGDQISGCQMFGWQNVWELKCVWSQGTYDGQLSDGNMSTVELQYIVEPEKMWIADRAKEWNLRGKSLLLKGLSTAQFILNNCIGPQKCIELITNFLKAFKLVGSY